MAPSKSITLAAAVAAALLVLATSAPLGNLGRARRDNPAVDLLSPVYAGLDVLYQVSVFELMQKFNLGSTVNASNIGSEIKLKTALDVTCDLFRAKTDLIPAISNATIITPVVKTINDANLNDSCRWLSEVVEAKSVGSGMVECSSGNIADICRRWGSINQFNSTKTDTFNLRNAVANANTTSWVASKQFDTTVLSAINGIVFSSSQ